MKRRYRYLAAALAALLLTGCAQTPPPETTAPTQATTEATEPRRLTPEEIYSGASASTVEISAKGAGMKKTGTGFFADEKGTVVTNFHVIEGMDSATIKMADGTVADVLGAVAFSQELDLALLATDCGESVPLPRRENGPVTGETVYAIGSSLGLTGSFSDGMVSTASRDVEGTEYIQISVPISHGNSGGPLLDGWGRVIGITSAGFTEGQNLNLAIPIGKIDLLERVEVMTLDAVYRATDPTEQVRGFLRKHGTKSGTDVYTLTVKGLTGKSLCFNRFTIAADGEMLFLAGSRGSISVKAGGETVTRYALFLGIEWDPATGLCQLAAYSANSATGEIQAEAWLADYPLEALYPGELADLLMTDYYTDTDIGSFEVTCGNSYADLLSLFAGWLKESNISATVEDLGFHT